MLIGNDEQNVGKRVASGCVLAMGHGSGWLRGRVGSGLGIPLLYVCTALSTIDFLTLARFKWYKRTN